MKLLFYKLSSRMILTMSNFTNLRIFACIALILLSTVGYGQWGAPYSNQWVNYDQEYYKVEIREEGLYRIPFNSLPDVIKNADKSKIQIFKAGKEIAIISVDAEGILFHGVPNRGETDSLLYRPMSSRINPYSSLFSNASAYFITVGKENGRRAQSITGQANANLGLTSKHRAEVLVLREEEYSLSVLSAIYPKFMNSYYEKGASKSGIKHLGDTLIITSVVAPNILFDTESKTQLKMLLYGRSNLDRDIEVFAGRTAGTMRSLGKVRINQFEPKLFESTLTQMDFDAAGKVFIGYRSSQKDRLERFSLSYLSIQYDQDLLLKGEKTKYFAMPQQGKTSLRFGISDIPTTDYTAYEISDPSSPIIIKGDLKDITVPATRTANYKLCVSQEQTVLTSSQVVKAKLDKLDPKDYNYLIITNDKLLSSANEYAAYRKSEKGGSFKPLIINIKDIYNQFNYGEASPVGVRRFVDYMVSDGNKNKYLLLLGTSVTFVERMRKDLEGDIPTIGYPGSDILLVSGLQGENENVPVIPVGRISASTDQQALDYLNKVKSYESAENTDVSWRKKVLHINGGKTEAEINSFSGELAKISPIITNSFLGGEVKPFIKQTLEPTEQVDISGDVNAGVGMITYVGHGSQSITDLDFGYASLEANGYRNKDKYPLMYFNGCGVGNMFNNRLNPNLSASDKMPLALDWLLAKDKGAVSIIANSFDSYLGPSVKYLETLYETLFADAGADGLSIGRNQVNAIKKIISRPGLNAYDIANVHQSVLNGDPAIRLFALGKPDYTFDKVEGLTIEAKDKTKNIEQSDSLSLTIPLLNLGRYNKAEQVGVHVKVTMKNAQVIIINKVLPAWTYAEKLSLNFKKGTQIINDIEVRLDESNLLNESNESNNRLSMTVNWELAKVLQLYSHASDTDKIIPHLEASLDREVIVVGNSYRPNPQVSVKVLDDRSNAFNKQSLSIHYKKCRDNSCGFVAVDLDEVSSLSIKQISDQIYEVSFIPDFLTKVGEYEFLIRATDETGNVSLPYQVYFQIAETSTNIDLVVSPNPASDYVRFATKFENENNEISSAVLHIYNATGILQFKKEFDVKQLNTLEYYWLPQVPAGTYIYNWEFFNGNQSTDKRTGKVVVVR